MLQMNQNKRIFDLFLLFIIFQPVIDVLTTFSIMVLKTDATVGLLIRLLYMAGSGLFILSQFKKHKYAKWFTLYFIGLGIFILANIGVNYFVKPTFILMDEIKFFTKLVYGNVIFLNFILVFHYLKANSEKMQKQFLQKIMYSATIIGLIMVISYVTNTGISSYTWTKVGYTGWFYGANDIGAVLAIITPIVLFYCIHMTKNMKHLYYWIPFVLIGISLIMLGTKVGYGTLLISLVIAFCSLIISFFIGKNQAVKKVFRFNLLITFFMLVTLVIITPFTPLYKNTFAHMQLLGIDIQKEEPVEKPKEKKEKKKVVKEEKPQINNEQMEQLILSSRDVYLNEHKSQYAAAPFSQKVFGMGYSGNYKEYPKMIEMDFYDIFFSTGVIGTILFFIPFIYFGAKVIFSLLKRWPLIFTPKYSLFISSVLLTLGTSFIAGHVFTTPSASIYFAVIWAFLVTDLSVIENKGQRAEDDYFGAANIR